MTTGTQRRQAIIDQVASCVCKDRQNTYGDAESNFENIAEYWTVWLRSRKLIAPDASVQAHDVAVMSGLIKVARLSTSPDHIDNWVDLAGYSVCGGGIRTKAKERKPCKEEIAVGSRWEHVQTREPAFVEDVVADVVLYKTRTGVVRTLMRDEFLGWHVPKNRSQAPVGPAKFPENAGETVTSPQPTPDITLPDIKIGSKWKHRSFPNDKPVVVVGSTALAVAIMAGNLSATFPTEEFLRHYEPCTD